MIINYPLSTCKNKKYLELPLNLNSKKAINLKAMLSLKQAGDMAYYNKRNNSSRKTFFSALQINEKRIFSVYQKHTKKVVFIKKGTIPEDYSSQIADGMITDDSNCILSITVGDCLPIFIIDKSNYDFGLIHSGWKGTGIIKVATSLMKKKLGTNLKNLKVLIGPGIGPCCYKVEKKRYNFIISSFGRNAGQIKNNGFYIDMKQANINMLNKLGIEDIAIVEDCTCCNLNLSSFRRDGKLGLNLMIALIGYFHGGGK